MTLGKFRNVVRLPQFRDSTVPRYRANSVRIPTLAALEQGIPVIAVRENRNLMKNDLSTLPWAPGQLHRVGNYWEAVGVIAAMRAGIDPASVRRPLAETFVSQFAASCSEPESEALRVANR